MSPIKDFLSGFQSYKHGYRWLREHPRYLIASLLPIVLSIVLMLMSFGWLMGTMDSLLSAMWIPQPENWWKTILHYLASGLVSLIALYLALSLIPILNNILSSPIYEWVSTAIEIDRGIPQEPTTWVMSLKIMKDEAAKMLLMLSINMLLIFIPGTGVLTPIVTAFFLGWSAFDYPLARRGWSIARRWNLIKNHLFSITGLGIWLMIPVLQIVLMPMAIAGGTLLAIETLDLPEPERNIL